MLCGYFCKIDKSFLSNLLELKSKKSYSARLRHRLVQFYFEENEDYEETERTGPKTSCNVEDLNIAVIKLRYACALMCVYKR